MSSMLTTVDNPYDPRLDFAAWFYWDVDQGYNTCAYLDRMSYIADDVPELVRERQLELAMDEIVALHNGELYKKLPIEAAA